MELTGTQAYISKLSELCGKYDIAFLGIFGSYARGDFTGKSDLDLLVRFSRRKSLLELVRIQREISEALGVKVDLLTEKSISPYLKEKIISSLKVIYDRER
jgi:predicted nucleotidyltransferase